jgi:hypothetical protein
MQVEKSTNAKSARKNKLVYLLFAFAGVSRFDHNKLHFPEADIVSFDQHPKRYLLYT